MRNLTKTLVAVSLLTSTSVHSLGIGGIKLRSALNQKLNAEIALVASGAENIGDIQVKLAPPAKFDEAGVPWTYFLTKIKFSPVVKSDGSIVVKLISDEVLKEPYLDFLLEVIGPSGSLYREFTVLVDPPATYKQPAIPVVTHSARIRNAETSVPEQFNQDVAEEPRASDYKQSELANYINSSIEEYGPVRKSDTIWSIANQVRTDGVTAAQMAMAIYEANPDAFSRPNVNALLAGSTLSIPDRDSAMQLSQSQALTEFKQHGASWRGVTHVVKRHIERKPKNLTPKYEAETFVAKPTETVKQLKLAPPLENELTDGDVVSNSQVGANNTEGASSGSEVVAETKTRVSREDAELKQRFDKIEQQLQMMQKLLELKDAQLATLQNKSVPVNSEVAPNTTQLPTDPVSQIVDPPVNPLEPVEGNKADTAKPALLNAEPEPMVVPAKPVNKPVAQAAVPQVINPPADPFADYYLLAGGIGASLLGALGLIWWRKRKTEQPIDTESMFASASQISLPDAEREVVKPVSKVAGYDVGAVAESAFLSEFTPSEFDAFETDQTEIDPMSEADVYLAYGRYQQAEELIRQVISEHPNRNECKLKLLEIYQASENKSEFNQYVRQLINDGKQSDSVFWAKVVEMADEFTPGSGALITLPDDTETLVAGLYQASETGAAKINSSKPATNELDFDFDQLAADDSISASVTDSVVSFDKQRNESTASVQSVLSLNQDSDFASTASFGGGSFDVENDQNSSLLKLADDDSMLDFDLNDFAQDNSVGTDDNAIEFLNEDDTNSLDFDLNAFALENVESDGEQLEFIEESENNGLDFDLNAFAGELTPTGSDEADSLSFNSILNAEPQAVGRNKASLLGEKGLTDNNFDFNFSLSDDSADVKLAKENASANLNFTDEDDVLLDDFDFSTTGLNLTKVTGDEDLGEEDFNFEFDFNPALIEATSNSEKPLEVNEVDDLTDSYSAFETKINLANAYVDMGDIEAAKVIANDLLSGTAEQVKAGKEIIEKIS